MLIDEMEITQHRKGGKTILRLGFSIEMRRLWNKIFRDYDSTSLQKQIQDAQNYLYKELDKSIIKQLLMAVLNEELLPILEYPETVTPNAMPMTYSKQYDHKINIHTPIPKLVLYKLSDATTKLDWTPDEFFKAIKDMKERVEKYGTL